MFLLQVNNWHYNRGYWGIFVKMHIRHICLIKDHWITLWSGPSSSQVSQLTSQEGWEPDQLAFTPPAGWLLAWTLTDYLLQAQQAMPTQQQMPTPIISRITLGKQNCLWQKIFFSWQSNCSVLTTTKSWQSFNLKFKADLCSPGCQSLQQRSLQQRPAE